MIAYPYFRRINGIHVTSKNERMGKNVRSMKETCLLISWARSRDNAQSISMQVSFVLRTFLPILSYLDFPWIPLLSLALTYFSQWVIMKRLLFISGPQCMVDPILSTPWDRPSPPWRFRFPLLSMISISPDLGQAPYQSCAGIAQIAKITDHIFNASYEHYRRNK